jgi:hypothetical protein
MLRSSCLILLIFAGVAAADVQNGLVRSGGQPIPGATVSAECGTDSKITTTTDDAGRFEIGGLPSTSCKYTVLMFGFEPSQKDAAASSTPLTFDLTLQARASIPVAPTPTPAPAVISSAPSTPAPAATTPPPAPAEAPPAPMPSMVAAQAAANAPQGGRGRGARGATGATGATGRGGRGAQARNNGGQAGFQNLNLVQSADATAASDAPISATGGADAGVAAGDAFTVNGTLSNGLQAQAGDGMGMGGPGGFGFGPGGPGGIGGDQFGGPGGPGGGRGGAGGGRGGGAGGLGGPGGPGGAGGAGGFLTGGGAGGPGGGGGGRGGGGAGGGRGGAGGRGRGPNGTTAFGNRAGRGRGPQWQASLVYTFANSALNARPFNYEGESTVPPKASTANNQLGFTLGGPLMVPHTKFNLKNSRWNLNLSGVRNRVGVDDTSSVPTVAQRSGDLSGLLTGANPTVIYNPYTLVNGNNQPFPNNMIPASLISPTALALLNYYPLPTGPGTTNNYQLIRSAPSNNTNFNLQISDPITTKDRVNINMSRQSRHLETVQPFGFTDPTNGLGENLSVSYAKTLRPTTVNTLTLAANRNVTNAFSYFSAGSPGYAGNIDAQLGIAGLTLTPATYGPPTINLQNFGDITDSTPSTNHSATFTLTDMIQKTKGKHNMNIGWTGAKRFTNSLTATNARGNFGFSGINTEQQINGVPVTTTGYDFADFLLALPATATANQFLNGNDVFYYRQHNTAAYFNDDFRLSTKVTLNFGLRWEYFAPETEKYNHMANIVFSPTGNQVQLMAPGDTNPYTDTITPPGLINSDYKMFEPQFGLAAKPWKAPIVFRTGYGIRYNGGALQTQGGKLAIQPPFVNTISLTSDTLPVGDVTLNNGLLFGSTAYTNPNTYAISPNYKPAMAQQFNAIVQYTLGRSYVFQLSYFGTKGSDLDVLLGPNRSPATPLAANASLLLPYKGILSPSIELDESVGKSFYNAGSSQVTRRFAHGIAGSATYTFAKSIDDSSTLGGGVVQIENDILAERAVTASVPRQTLATTFNLQTFPQNQKPQFYMNFIRGWQLNGTYSVNTGTPFTATVQGDPSNTGTIGSARANATGLPVEDGTGYFNPAAFSVPASGTYGTAGRNTIPGIVNFAITASAIRSFRFGERRRLQLTFTATNPLNHPSVTGINTIIGSKLEDTITNVGNMRVVSAVARFTF